jgi:hypothetical protein
MDGGRRAVTFGGFPPGPVRGRLEAHPFGAPAVRALVAILLLLLPVAASAAEAPSTVVEAQATQAAIVRKLQSDDYDHVKRGHREKIAEAQRTLAALPQDGGAEDVARAAALVATIDELMADAELDREVCHRERPMGSNRMVRVCRTRRQMAAESESLRTGSAMRSRSCGYTRCN